MEAQQSTPDVQVSVGFLVTSHLAMAAVAVVGCSSRTVVFGE